MKNSFHGIAKISALCALFAWILALSGIPTAHATVLSQQHPRLANYFLKSPITTAEARQLARWDVLILGAELQYTSPWIFPILRELNPDILLLAYVPSEEIPLSNFEITDPLHPNGILARGVPDEWRLKASDGTSISNWPGTVMVNVTLNAPVVGGLQWNAYLPTFVHEHVMSTGLWNGIFYDNVWPDISWMNGGNIDLDGNGIAESGSVLDQAWADGMSSLLAYSRRLEGNDAIIIGNGGGRYYTSMNGRLMEEFPSVEEGGWTGGMEKYIDVMKRGASPSLVVINTKSSTGLVTDERAMRFGLASTLMDNGFFSFDAGVFSHAEIWWYDEYGVALGKPVGKRQNLKKPSSTTIEAGVWRRDFENGIVLLNSTDRTQTIRLADAYEEITTTQEPTTNDGNIVTSATLAPYDAILLLRRQFSVQQGQYRNGAFARSFTLDGTATRQAFLTYDESLSGGAQVIKEDLDTDGDIETIAALGNRVTITDSQGNTIGSFFPYGTRYRRSVTIAVGDVTGNPLKEIVTGAGDGGGPHVRIFSNTGRLLSPGFFAYNKHFRGGVNVAVGDVTGDGKAEIVTGAGIRGGPHIRVFTEHGKPLNSFFAYNKHFRGGVNVAVGDVTGDGKAEIVSAPGKGGSPHIRIFSAQGDALSSFYAFDRSLTSGVFVSLLDINGDLINDIVVSAPTIN